MSTQTASAILFLMAFFLLVIGMPVSNFYSAYSSYKTIESQCQKFQKFDGWHGKIYTCEEMK